MINANKVEFTKTEKNHNLKKKQIKKQACCTHNSGFGETDDRIWRILIFGKSCLNFEPWSKKEYDIFNINQSQPLLLIKRKLHFK